MRRRVQRRDFLTAFGSIGLISLYSASGRAASAPRRVGVLYSFAGAESLGKALEGLGWHAGRDLVIDVRVADGDADLARLARELVASAPDVVVTWATPATRAILAETRRIPVVFASVGDPIGSGFVASLSHPSGNATGFTNLEASITAKMLQLLKDIDPRLVRAALMYNPDISTDRDARYFAPFAAEAARLGIEARDGKVETMAEIEALARSLAAEPGGGLVVLPDVFNDEHSPGIVALTRIQSLPAIFVERFDGTHEALLTYGPSYAGLTQRVAGYVDRILKGEAPSSLSVQGPTKFTLTLNLRTAKALGITVPLSLMAQADEVIE